MKIQLCITGINYILNYIKIENRFFMVIILLFYWILYQISDLKMNNTQTYV